MTTTIEAALVAAGVGLPIMWAGQWPGRPDQGGFYVAGTSAGDRALREGRVVTLLEEQTAFGVALRLDAWELAGDHPPHPGWVESYGYFAANPKGDGPDWDADTLTPFLGRMTARITHIGRDHRIRRALGWTVGSGTLAELTMDRPGLWLFQDHTIGRARWFSHAPGAADLVSALVPGVTDPTEALTAIDAALETQ